MQYDIRFPAATKGWRVAAGLDVCYQIPTNLIHVNRDVDVTDVLATVTDDHPAESEAEFSVRLQARNIDFGDRVARHSPLAVAMNLSEYLRIAAILPGPDLEFDRWWLVRPDRTHRIVSLEPTALERGVYLPTDHAPPG